VSGGKQRVVTGRGPLISETRLGAETGGRHTAWTHVGLLGLKDSSGPVYYSLFQPRYVYVWTLLRLATAHI
jgi:hypothetical protein